jgi:hypothetical protein
MIFQAMRKLNCNSPFLRVRYEILNNSHISFSISICISISLTVHISFLTICAHLTTGGSLNKLSSYTILQIFAKIIEQIQVLVKMEQ